MSILPQNHSRDEMFSPLLIPTFHQVPYTTLISRIDQGSQGLFELVNLLNDRRELEEKNIYYLSKVSHANLFSYEIETSSSERLLGFFKNYHMYLSKENIRSHKEFNEQVIRVLEDFKIHRASLVNKNKSLIQNKLREVSQAEDLLDRAKKQYFKAKKDLERSNEKLAAAERACIEYKQHQEEKKAVAKEGGKFNMSRMFTAFESTPDQEKEKQQKKVTRRKEELNQAWDNILHRKQHLLDLLSELDEAFHKTAYEFEDIETDRMRKLNNSLKAFCKSERSNLEFRLEQLTLLEEAVSQQNVSEDVALYIERSKQTEYTHKYASALRLIDEYYRKNKSKEEMLAMLRENRNDGINNNWVADALAFVAQPDVLDDSIKPEALKHSQSEERKTADLENEEEDGEGNKQPRANVESDNTGENGSNAAVTDEPQSPKEPVPVAFPELTKLFEQVFHSKLSLEALDVDQDSRNSIPTPIPFSEQEENEIDEDTWTTVLEGKDYRQRFLQELDYRRCHNATITERGYASLLNAMKIFLDYCEIDNDVRSAMRLKNMANTFHCLSDAENSEATQDRDSLSSKRYLHSDYSILHHAIWKVPGFWETALKEDIFQQLDKSPVEPWDELSPEALREAVINIHSMVYGQLGSLAMTMNEQGLTKNEVVHQIKILSRKFQLPEDQEFELLSALTGQTVKTYVPPPVIPTVIKARNIEFSTTEVPTTTMVEAVSVESAPSSNNSQPPAASPSTNRKEILFDPVSPPPPISLSEKSPASKSKSLTPPDSSPTHATVSQSEKLHPSVPMKRSSMPPLPSESPAGGQQVIMAAPTTAVKRNTISSQEPLLQETAPAATSKRGHLRNFLQSMRSGSSSSNVGGSRTGAGSRVTHNQNDDEDFAVL